MNYIRKKIKITVIIGFLFILGGIISVYAAIRDYRQSSSAPYRMQATSDVISLWTEEVNTAVDPMDTSKSVTEYCTEEEIEINGKVMSFNGRYSDDPGGHVSHTLISYDGVNYEVNDNDSQSTLVNIIAGIIFLIAGFVMTIFSFKRFR